MSVNMVEAIQIECNRVRVLIGILDHCQDAGVAVAQMRELINRSEHAIAELDAVDCVRCLSSLREIHL